MLRPATPLTILLFAAFALLLISVISTPIVKGIPLASFGGVDFGVFGFCKTGGKCSSIEIGYDTTSLYNDAQASTFDLPTGTRTTLSAILIVHPIAALFTLIMLCMAGAAHFHSPSHSPRYLLGIFILSILTLICSLLSFLIDVLLFVPHMAWGSYIVLAATILIAASGIVSCAMRRTLVSRKARKRRIAENAEMNGENFYNRQDVPAPVAVSTAPVMVNGAPGGDKLPSFATFETQKEKERTSDERIPLTQMTPSENSPHNEPRSMESDRYGGPPRSQSRGRGSPPRDQYGNAMPLLPPGNYGMRSRDPSLDRQYSDPAMGGRGIPPGGYRGRGGYGPPNGRGGYAPSRGGYGPPRGGYGPPRGGGPYRGGMSEPLAAIPGGMAAGAMMRGGRGGPPPGYGAPQNGRGGYRGPSPGGNYPRRPSPPQAPGYGAETYNARAPPPTGQYAAYNPDDSRSSLPRAESPPPISTLEGPVGQAVEMDASTGSPSHAPKGYGQFGPLRDSDGDVAGMVGLQQQRVQRDAVVSESSRYSTDEYVPPRQGWGDAGRSSPLNPASQPTELPSSRGHKRISSAGDNYYEDIDPRFADNPPSTHPSAVPAALAPAGVFPLNTSMGNLHPIGGMDGNNSYEDIQSGARSPAESDRSNFTSVSQRGINPRWNPGPGPGQGYGSLMPNRRPTNPPPQQQQSDLLLNSNPDFQLPTGRGRGGAPAGRGRIPGGIPGMVPSSAYPGGSAL
ncbi:pH-response regulator protein [Lachnellula subtilissima]|uniref:pH-response regulator protein n=1 Tax=Lachnellula subtilissima TaxID=602034 RepID=A0A8H8U8X9_9HELO|nr:pH-response regulator protein [Lachnellula subtilissima]